MGSKNNNEEFENKIIIENYLKIPVKRLAVKIGRSGTCVRNRIKKLGLEIPKEIIEQRKKDSWLKKGHTPKNKGKKRSEYLTAESIKKMEKTQFKKGNKPHNTNYDGHERKTKDGYIMIRVNIKNYRLKHIVEWEKVNGKIPDGYCLWNKDGNKENTKPENWELISRKENINRNIHQYPLEVQRAMKLQGRINKIIKNEK